ncbi:S8 family serine peptidase [Salininema proteolyticum]|uniref:S8 family serine peptidase n=1 Tax=Salininema proteolyticum TaxID=1607685 RepID=A0ABV8TZJ0_9ACTN
MPSHYPFLRRRGAASLAAGIVLALAVSTPAAADPSDAEIRNADSDNAIDGHYIVKLAEPASDERVSELAAEYGGTVTDVLDSVDAFTVSVEEAGAERLVAEEIVDVVEQDTMVSDDGVIERPAAQASEVDAATVASWGLDRIDQRDLPLDDSYTDPNGGEGVNLYIIDSGIRGTHEEFGGRVLPGVDFVDPERDGRYDCRHHGTHVAGTAGGSQHGVARQAALIPVRVLNCDGYTPLSRMIAGVEWVTENAELPAVANVSIRNSPSDVLNAAVAASVEAGVVYVASAGNNDTTACSQSPADEPSAITVAASNEADARWESSNYGECVDIFAPGQHIPSSIATDDSSYASGTGTSMAVPHVVGVAAQYLSDHPRATPSRVARALTANASRDRIADAGPDSPNLMLYNGFLTGDGDPCVMAPWSLAETYTAGDEVSHERTAYRAKWWTEGEEPGAPGTAAWERIGAC